MARRNSDAPIGVTTMNANFRQSLRRYLLHAASFCLVVAWVGCKSASPYDQLEIEKKRNEQMEGERENKGWFRTSVAVPLDGTRD